jgi:hypothetical protein
MSLSILREYNVLQQTCPESLLELQSPFHSLQERGQGSFQSEETESNIQASHAARWVESHLFPLLFFDEDIRADAPFLSSLQHVHLHAPEPSLPWRGQGFLVCRLAVFGAGNPCPYAFVGTPDRGKPCPYAFWRWARGANSRGMYVGMIGRSLPPGQTPGLCCFGVVRR